MKLAPLILHLREQGSDLHPVLCVTAQHRDLLDGVLDVFGLQPDIDLNIMRPDQTLSGITSAVLTGLEGTFREVQPDLTVVQGDTTTTFAGALASFYARIPVAHVEAGLRTGNRYSPFPEEVNRGLTGRIASLHFAATEWAAENLRSEGVAPESITVTGNTGIDALLRIHKRLASGELRPHGLPELDPGRRLILLTAHRRESFGSGFEGICEAIRQLGRREDVQIVIPVHPNPQVRNTLCDNLTGIPGVLLVDPLPYTAFVSLMSRACLILTDSGGVQEEAPSLGKPVLVMRENTERPEAVSAGTARLVGTNPETIIRETFQLLDDPQAYLRMSQATNPYGDGEASGRISNIMRDFLIKWK